MSALSCPHFSFMFRNIDSKIFLTVIWLRILNRLTVLNWWCKDKFDGLNVPVIFILFAKFFAYLIITPVRIHSFSSIDTPVENLCCLHSVMQVKASEIYEKMVIRLQATPRKNMYFIHIYLCKYRPELSIILQQRFFQTDYF
jgi:hypothetical protein